MARDKEPTRVIPALGNIWDSLSDFAYPLLRVSAGVILLTHGWPKVAKFGLAGVSGAMARYGIEPSTLAAIIVMFLETAGAILIVIGLFTRPIAALLVIEFLVIIFVAHWPRGWSASAGGIEYPLLWGICFLVILIRGGGKYSVDRSIGKEI